MDRAWFIVYLIALLYKIKTNECDQYSVISIYTSKSFRKNTNKQGIDRKVIYI